MIIRLILIGILLFTAACSTTGKIEPKIDITADLSVYDSVSVSVTSDLLNTEKEELLEIEEMLVEQLADESRFSSVSSCSKNPGSKADLSLVVKVLRMPLVGVQDFTVFSSGQIDMGVILIDGRTGETIGSCSVEAKAKGGGIWSRASWRAIDRAVEKVIQFVMTG